MNSVTVFFECPMCSRWFRRRFNFNRHLRVHQRARLGPSPEPRLRQSTLPFSAPATTTTSEQRRFCCHDRGAAFVTGFRLRRHQQFHCPVRRGCRPPQNSTPITTPAGGGAGRNQYGAGSRSSQSIRELVVVAPLD